MSSGKGAEPSEFLSCTSLALKLCRGKVACYPFLSHGSLALAPCSLPPLSLQLWSSAVGSRKVQHTQEKSPWMSAPLKQPKARLNSMVPRVLSSRRPGKGAGGPVRSGAAPTPLALRCRSEPRQTARRSGFLQGQGVG